jgi:hypothetical protein
MLVIPYIPILTIYSIDLHKAIGSDSSSLDTYKVKALKDMAIWTKERLIDARSHSSYSPPF